MKTLIAQPWFVLLCWVAFWSLPEATVMRLAIEDGPIEDAGALAFFVAAALFFAAYLNSRRAGKPSSTAASGRPNFLLIMLALAFLLGAGEEISWGQRIFGWETPEAIAKINVQNETTIHNLDIFQQGRSFSFWFNVFWVGFCVLVPVVARWQPARALLARIRIPVLPIWTGLLLIVNYAVFKLVVAVEYPDQSELRHAANELKETTIAIVFVWIAWIVYQQERGSLAEPFKPPDRAH